MKNVEVQHMIERYLEGSMPPPGVEMLWLEMLAKPNPDSPKSIPGLCHF